MRALSGTSSRVATMAALSLALSGGAVSGEKPGNSPSFEIPAWTGEVIARHAGKTGKNVVYVLDHHAGGNGMDMALKWLDPVGLTVQRNIFQMLDATVSKNGSIALVHESWSLRQGESPTEMARRNLLGSLLSPGLEDGSGKTLDGGHSKAVELVGNSVHQATNLISAVYGSKVANIAPMTEAKEIEWLRRDYRIGVMKMLISSPKSTCGNFGSKPENLPLYEATMLREPTECGCGVKNSYSRELLSWSKARYKEAAIREVDSALKSKASMVIIVAGSGHAYHAMKHLREKWVSYQVVKPAGMNLSDVSLFTDPVNGMVEKIKDGNVCTSEKLPSFERFVDKKAEDVVRKYQAVFMNGSKK